MNRKRYFQELSNKEKYPVGKLSPELRQALHLEDDMLPFWIYRMRVLGYPPAWMKEAEMSTLDVIDTAGSTALGKERNPFGTGEEGEIKDTAQYNKDSLIEFPGFNAPIPENVKDDWLILGMPPLIMKQQLSEAVKSMKLIEPVPYRKSKLDLSTTKDDSQIISPDSPPNNDASTTTDSDVILIENAVSEESDLNKSAKDPSKNETTEDDGANTSANTSQMVEEDTNNEISNGTSERKLKVISMGAPVPTSIKPNLPPLENWAKDMGELMYFENLPTSTGAYKGKMKGILNKVRNRFGKTEPDN